MDQAVFLLIQLKNIIDGARRDDLTFVEQCALFAAASVSVAKIRDKVKTWGNSDAYAFEKAHKVGWHIGAALGFDVTNGHDARQHLSWAYGQLNSLEDALGPYTAEFRPAD